MSVEKHGKGGFAEVFDAIRFAPPKEDGESSDACVAKAYVMPGRAALRVALRGCKVVRVRESRKNVPTVHFLCGRHELEMLMALDERVVAIAKTSIDAWFMHKMNPDLVEEYYRGNTETDIKHGIVARIVIDGKLAKRMASPSETPVDVTLRLVGVQFRRQFFTPVWKIVSAEPSSIKSVSCHPSFLVDDQVDGDDITGEDEQDDAGPTQDECLEMRQTLMATLIAREGKVEDDLNKVRHLIQRLYRSTICDIQTLESVSDALVQ